MSRCRSRARSCSTPRHAGGRVRTTPSQVRAGHPARGAQGGRALSRRSRLGGVRRGHPAAVAERVRDRPQAGEPAVGRGERAGDRCACCGAAGVDLADVRSAREPVSARAAGAHGPARDQGLGASPRSPRPTPSASSRAATRRSRTSTWSTRRTWTTSASRRAGRTASTTARTTTPRARSAWSSWPRRSAGRAPARSGRSSS